jgi:hypothetical protein
MGTSEPKSWAEIFAAELVVDGERIPFERLLARHLDAVTKLRKASGHTWPSIASMLVRAGARRSDGGLISADQIRVSYARLLHQKTLAKQILEPEPEVRADTTSRKSAGASAASGGLPASTRHRNRPAIVQARVPDVPHDFPSSITDALSDEDVSNDEINSALERLSKRNAK